MCEAHRDPSGPRAGQNETTTNRLEDEVLRAPDDGEDLGGRVVLLLVACLVFLSAHGSRPPAADGGRSMSLVRTWVERVAGHQSTLGVGISAAAEAGAAIWAAVGVRGVGAIGDPRGRAGVAFSAGLLRGEGRGLRPAAAVALGSATAAAVIAAVASEFENGQ